MPRRTLFCGAMDLVVRERDRLARAIGERPRLALESRPHRRQRDVGGRTAGGVAADPVDHQEQSSAEVDVNAIFVDAATQADVAVSGSPERGCGRHQVAHPARCER